MRVNITDNGRHANVEFCLDTEWCRKYRIRGVVIWPKIYFNCPGKELPQELFRHELEHAYQIMRLGVVRFYLKYFWYRLRGYDSHPLEIEAWAAQRNPLTHHEEKILWKLRDA